MRQYSLGFITDEHIYHHVKETIEKYRFSMDLKKFNKNLVDPIKLTFDSKIYGKTIEEVIESEVIRQMDKSNTNHIGYFHQNIFRYFGGGWEVLSKGYDVVNVNQNIYVEMKNKHNTMNSDFSQKTYMKMQNTILQNADANCFLVEVIAKNSQNITWQISLNGAPISNRHIRRVSIDKFYEMVTGNPDSFKNLCEKLPLIIDDVMSEMTFNPIENTVIEDLKKLSPNVLKSIYLLSFKRYEGFGSFSL